MDFNAKLFHDCGTKSARACRGHGRKGSTLDDLRCAPEALAVPGRPGVRVIAKQFGVSRFKNFWR
jgi:hypothetical protein